MARKPHTQGERLVRRGRSQSIVDFAACRHFTERSRVTARSDSDSSRKRGPSFGTHYVAILSLTIASAAPLHVAGQARRASTSQTQQQSRPVEHISERAERGDPIAQYDLAVRLARGTSGQAWPSESIHWLQLAAEQGHSQAQFDLALLYYRGVGISKDPGQAAAWFRRAAEQGHAASQAALGRLYYLGDGVSQNATRAAEWYVKAARQGLAGAQYNLAGLYAAGNGVPKDSAHAGKWYRKAAEQGLAEAQYALGVALIRGDGVGRDASWAAHWLRRAAERGFAEAQHLLAWQYETGTGPSQDLERAAYWYGRAADQGVVDAQSALGQLHRSGRGGSIDPVQAQMWLIIAARNAPRESRERLAMERDEAARGLTARQAADAERLASEWAPETSPTLKGQSLEGVPAEAQSGDLDRFFRTAGEKIAAARVEYDKYWRPHIEMSRRGILEAARLVRTPRTALVLGAGRCIEIPVEELARQFQRVVLVDLDGESLRAALASVPESLRQKVELRHSDMTSFAEPLMEETAHIMERSEAAPIAIARLRSLYDRMDALRRPPDLPRADLIVSSLVLSELFRYPSTFAAQLFRERFDEDLAASRVYRSLWRKLRAFAMRDHAATIARLGQPGSIVYFADTVGRGPDSGWLGTNERRIALASFAMRIARIGLFRELRANPAAWSRFRDTFQDLGSGGEAANPANGAASPTGAESLVSSLEHGGDGTLAGANLIAEAAIGLLCRGHLSTDSEIAAFEALLDSYQAAEPRTVEPLVDWNAFIRVLSEHDVEPTGDPRSWKWLEYACQIPRQKGGFTVRSVILQTSRLD